MMNALDLVERGGNTVKFFIQSMFCKINTLCGTLDKETYSPNIYITSMFEIKSKNQTYETVPSCLSPKTTEWIKRSTRTMNFFFFCKYYILQKRTAGEKMHLKSSFKNKRSIIPYILHICYTIIHSDHKTK